jgi:cardiolipin synthase
VAALKHIPNVLSLCRIALIPLFIWQLQTDRMQWAALTLAVSGLTDMLDGSLARHFGWISPLGKVLDPAADKLTQVTVCLLLAIRFRQYWPLFAVLLVKELLMLILGGYLMRQGARLEGAKWFGKVVTVLFYISMTLILLVPTLPPWLMVTMLSLTVCAAITAAVLYFPEFQRYANSRNERTGNR